jgi:3-hydroxyacyl-CoA dehydrogenase/enoyl-CoA hydratase/3-hydroxybutyryl-CoA epimerase/3-hydroxyacyl-CoA dehydrogenase/enoyl-CoA hydratase/3-hydroxybutyryl-CoA epimerase/enoyl-CoA isomerase
MSVSQPLRSAAKTPSAAFQFERREDGIALLTFDMPASRANILTETNLEELEALLKEIGVQSALHGLVLRSGKPGTFIAGADLRDLGAPTPDPNRARKLLRQGLAPIALFESLPFPTVAAIEGPCLGGGLEVALGCDYRLAGDHPKTELGLPEVKVGLIPGWGGTQRLSRLIGPALAADMITSGESVKAQRAREIGIVFDVVAGERLLDEAVRRAQAAFDSGDWREIRRRKQLPVGLTEEQHDFIFSAARSQVVAKTKGLLPAPLAALDAIANGCNRPLEEGLQVESAGFMPLFRSPISRNLIAVFFMTQRLQKDPGVADTSIQPRPVQAVTVAGAGIMGAGIALAHILRNIPVKLTDNNAQALDKGVATITKALQARIDSGRLTVPEMTAALLRLGTTSSVPVLADRDFVIEAIIENEEAKVQLYREIEPILRTDAILASNTSTISITRMARSLSRPGNFAGMHFFNPVERMPLVEVIRGQATDDVTVVTLVALAKRIGKTPIVVRDCPGFLVNRILFPYLNESLVLLEEGIDPRVIDKAATAFGMPMGPITLHDLVGLDTSLYAGRVVNTAFADRAKTTRLLDELVATGRLGQKSGAGFYSYAKGSRGIDDPAFTAIWERFRTGQRSMQTEELTDRLFLPMLVEASRVLEESIVREPGDVDMGLILGIGFPAFHGGILRWADTQGLPKVLEKLRRYEGLGARYQPTQQIRRLAGEGKGFYPD